MTLKPRRRILLKELPHKGLGVGCSPEMPITRTACYAVALLPHLPSCTSQQGFTSLLSVCRLQPIISSRSSQKPGPTTHRPFRIFGCMFAALGLLRGCSRLCRASRNLALLTRSFHAAEETRILEPSASNKHEQTLAKKMNGLPCVELAVCACCGSATMHPSALCKRPPGTPKTSNMDSGIGSPNAKWDSGPLGNPAYQERIHRTWLRSRNLVWKGPTAFSAHCASAARFLHTAFPRAPLPSVTCCRATQAGRFAE